MINVKFKQLALTLAAVASLTLSAACKRDKTYSDYLEDERNAISGYIHKHNIKVVSSRPDSSTEWIDPVSGDTVYYHYSNGLYFHLIEKGDTTTLAPKVGYRAFVRYIGRKLDGTLLYDYTSARSVNPVNFTVLSSPSTSDDYGVGFQTAVRNLYTGGHCTCIVPFKIGNSANTTVDGVFFSPADSYEPVFYEIWLTHVE